MTSKTRHLLTFPNMDYLSPIWGGLFEALGCAFYVPPPLSERSRELGRKLGREGFCQPLNNTIADIAVAVEQGATDVVFTAGHDPCRYGFYWVNQKIIIEEHLGREVAFHVIDHLDPRGSVEQILAAVDVSPGATEIDRVWQLTMEKIDALAAINTRANQVRPGEQRRGRTSRVYEKACKAVLSAPDLRALEKACGDAEQKLSRVAQRAFQDPLRVLLVGAIYEVLEPHSNYQIEEVLARLGVVVERSLSYQDLAEVFTDEGLIRHMAMEEKVTRHAARFIDPQLKEVGFGGYGRLTIGHAARAREDGFDGVVHVHSFSCMPEIVAKAFLKKISEVDSMPVMTIVVEEIATRELFESRIEAFVDLLREKRSAA